jgi:DNA-binding ferritin-like protein
MEKCDKMAALYLASLKALTLIHQHNHWIAKGDDFYGNHLLFQRLYEAVSEDVDSAAERFLGLFGEEFISYEYQFTLLNKILMKYKDLSNSPLELSLKIEKDFIKFADTAYKCFENEGKLTLGLEDLLPAISSKREEAVYLLQQALNQHE